MIYLQVGFAGEGSTDYEFLVPLLRRLIDELASQCSQLEFEIPEPVQIRLDGRFGNKPAGVVARVLSEHSYLDVLLYHTDAGGNLESAYRDRVSRVIDGLSGVSTHVVGVVPRRETEAWALADGKALARVLGSELGRLVIPPEFRPDRVESILDPKMELEKVVNSIRSPRSRRRGAASRYLGALALSIDTAVLCDVPQVGRAVDDLRTYFQRRGWC